MNIVYIYGWNSSPNSDTGKVLQALFPKHNVISPEYDQHNPIEAIEYFNNFIPENKINALVASSFGAFIALNIRHVIFRFLINPCIKPSIELPKLEEVSLDFISQCQKIENLEIIVDDEDMRFTTAFFATEDELFSYKTTYLAQGYFNFFDLEHENHHLSHNGLQFVAEEIKKKLEI